MNKSSQILNLNQFFNSLRIIIFIYQYLVIKLIINLMCQNPLNVKKLLNFFIKFF